ncbi:potassium-transporting ATPase subunit F [Caulobacter soli]
MTMLVSVLWAAGAIAVAGYMVAAMLRPDKF